MAKLEEIVERELRKLARETAKTLKQATKIGKAFLEDFFDEFSKDALKKEKEEEEEEEEG